MLLFMLFIHPENDVQIRGELHAKKKKEKKSHYSCLNVCNTLFTLQILWQFMMCFNVLEATLNCPIKSYINQ